MFDSLSNKLVGALDKLKNKGRIRSRDLEATLETIRTSLLEADVHFNVVKAFIEDVGEELKGVKLLPTLKPEQQIIGIVQKQMEALFGDPVEQDLTRTLMVGLQGSGKTTTTAKLALWLKNRKKHPPFLIPADLSRPAAIDQLKRLGEKHQLDVFDTDSKTTAVETCKLALTKISADKMATSAIIADSAGRLQVDDQLMDEIVAVKKVVDPTAVLLVVDSMTGQEAVHVARAFHERLGVTGIVLTKIDGDARGGAALSIRKETGIPIAFLGTGEDARALEIFDSKRIVSRIMGMGDLTGLLDKAQDVIDKEGADDIGDVGDLRNFTLKDFLKVYRMMQKMGPLKGLLGMVPGMAKASKGLDVSQAEASLKRVEAMILSMTPSERDEPKIIDGSRRKRICLGSGTSVSELNQFLKQYAQMRKMLKKMGPNGLAQMMRR